MINRWIGRLWEIPPIFDRWINPGDRRFGSVSAIHHLHETTIEKGSGWKIGKDLTDSDELTHNFGEPRRQDKTIP
jgi:hypothetical protein